VILAAVWIDPLADDEEEVYENNRISMLNALRNGSVNAPSVDAIHEASSNLGNGFYVPTQAKESRS
jgi:5,6,7,8-tetrahydromethanopterin hydro-lyase